jgi:hypothetical protein
MRLLRQENDFPLVNPKSDQGHNFSQSLISRRIATVPLPLGGDIVRPRRRVWYTSQIEFAIHSANENYDRMAGRARMTLGRLMGAAAI